MAKNKKQNEAETIDDLLERITVEDLKCFVKEQMSKGNILKQTFITSFSHLNSGESQEIYNKQISAILNAAEDHSGFINWSNARFVGRAVGDLLNTANKHFIDENYQSAVFICFAIMEEMVKALQFTDDSNGDIGGNIDMAFSQLYEISESEPPENIRSHIFNHCINEFQRNTFEGWDWHLGMLEIASVLVKNENDAERVISLLDSFTESNKSDYCHNKAQELKYSIIKEVKGDVEAEKYLEQNLLNPYLRKQAIQNALADKNYDKASALAEGGIKLNAIDKPGLVYDWYDWLLRIAIDQNDNQKIIHYARYLFINSNYKKQEYYKILKDRVNKNEWNEFVEDIISDIRKKDRWLNYEIIAQIYIQEKWWDKLYELLKKEPTLNRIHSLEKYLAGKYADQLADLYETAIVDLMKYSKNRKDYREACMYLKRMIKLGAVIKVNMLIEKFQKTYPQRRALLDELKHVK